MPTLKHNVPPFSAVKKAILYDIILPKMSRSWVLRNLEETENLLKTYGGITLVKVMQRRHHAGSKTYIGRSKFEEIITMACDLEANLMIINKALKSSQLYHLKKHLEDLKLQIDVWDRVDLILNIFKKHAKTAEAKLQLELAHLEHYGPRIYGMGDELSQQAGGIGTRGIGETNTEIMKRHLANRKRLILKRIKNLQNSRQLNRIKRAKNGLHTLSLIGYTNAGKSSLFRAFTCRKHITVQAKLFSTLDTTTSRLFLPNSGKMVLLSDTIGFIQNLPPKLIKAFKSTLEETLHASILLHVVDAFDPHFLTKIVHANQILKEIGCQHKPMLYLFNKYDLLQTQPTKSAFMSTLESFMQQHSSVFISAKTQEYFPNLLEVIEKKIFSIEAS